MNYEQELLKISYLYKKERNKLAESPLDIYKNAVIMRSFIDSKELNHELEQYIKNLEETANLIKKKES